MLPNLPHLQSDPESETDWFEALIALARYLRGPDGCPWDREQTSADFAKFAVEEARELVEAYDGKSNDSIREEFGDVLFVLLAAAAAAEEAGEFSLKDAMEQAHAKMIRRHEHVFGEVKAQSPQEAIDAWNAAKAREKSNPSD